MLTLIIINTKADKNKKNTNILDNFSRWNWKEKLEMVLIDLFLFYLL